MFRFLFSPRSSIEPASLNKVPADLRREIFSYLDTQSLGRLKQIHRIFRDDKEVQEKLNDRSKFIGVYSGQGYVFLLRKDGRVLVRGRCNDGYTLGLNGITSYDNDKFVVIPNLTDVKSIAVGGLHTLFLLKDGTVKGCGSNANGQLGVENYFQKFPTVIPGLTGVTQITAGFKHSVFVLENNRVKVCGRGQFGTVFPDEQISIPTYIPNLFNVLSASARETAYDTLFLLTDNTVKICDSNVEQPTLIQNLNDVKEIVIEADSNIFYVLFILNDGRVKAYGRNECGQLGFNTDGHSTDLTPVPNLANVNTAITGSWFSTLFLLHDGTARLCGSEFRLLQHPRKDKTLNYDDHILVNLPNFAPAKILSIKWNARKNIYLLLDDGRLMVSEYGYGLFNGKLRIDQYKRVRRFASACLFRPTEILAVKTFPPEIKKVVAEEEKSLELCKRR